jgi:RNA polymerase sigma-70 factor (ECF subfamily)
VHDLTQEVFVSLFADDARALRAWHPQRGLSLANFVGLIADHQVASIFRSGKRRPWCDALILEEDLDARPGRAEEESQVARDLYAKVMLRVRGALTPRGLDLFQRLILEEQSIDAVCAATGLSADAVYAWRSRLMKLVRETLKELDPALEAR